MVAWSKTLYCTCHELGHTWEPSCSKVCLEVASNAFVGAIKIYAPLYIIAAILRRKKKEYYLKKLLPEIFRSTLFLSTNAFSFIGLFCVWRALLGHVNFFIAFLPCVGASYLAIIMERQSRRSLLAVYMMNVALETIWNMCTYRKMVTPIKHGEVLLFSCVMAGFMYLYKSKDGLKDSMLSGFRFFIGPSELPPPELPPSVLELDQRRMNIDSHMQPIDTAAEASLNISSTLPASSSSSPTGGKPSFRSSQSSITSFLPQEFQVLIHKWRTGKKHRLCRHRDSCVASITEGFIRMFGTGYAIQAVVKLLSNLPTILRKPGALLNALKHRDNVKLGAFIASFVGIFKLMNCVLRWTRNRDNEIHGLISGFIAGWSMMFYKSSSMAMYMFSKLIEILYLKGIEAKLLPYVKHADIMIYTLSTALVFHATVFEPHNLRPAYWKFLLRVTNGRFGDMDRRLLDCFGTEASKMFPNFKSPLDDLKSSAI